MTTSPGLPPSSDCTWACFRSMTHASAENGLGNSAPTQANICFHSPLIAWQREYAHGIPRGFSLAESIRISTSPHHRPFFMSLIQQSRISLPHHPTSASLHCYPIASKPHPTTIVLFAYCNSIFQQGRVAMEAKATPCLLHLRSTRGRVALPHFRSSIPTHHI